MVNYRCNFTPGGTCFFTVALPDRRSRWLTGHIDGLRCAFRETRSAKPFHLDAIVVLPDHLHAIWTLPPEDADYPGRWKAIQAGFTRELRNRGLALPRRKDGSALVWQRSYWEHTIRDDKDLNAHSDYVHFNPVKHGWVNKVADWPHSSFHRHVRQGCLPENWGTGACCGVDFGEPGFET